MTQQRCNILLVEEEPILREITAFRLELLGYEVSSWEGANSANEWLLTQLPQLIVVGQVAETGAFDFLNQLSNEPRTSEIPVIFLSGSSDLEDVQKAYNAGADEFLVTPFDPLTLEKKVEELIGASRVVKT
ncbi:MAG: response regulator [Bythopirellula sp.]|nr:response regulator [Bythopirellula sp.]